MLPGCRLLAIFLVLSTSLANAPGQGKDKKDKKLFPDEKKAVDLYGDPLPENAMARLGTLRWRHLSSGRYRQVIDALAFSPDGKTLASLSAGNICLWETKSGAMLREFGSQNYCFDPWLRYSADGKTILAGGEKNRAPVVHYWNVAKGEDISSKKLGSKIPRRDLAPDGAVQAVKGDSLRLIDAVTKKELHKLPKCFEFAFSSKGKIACLMRNGVALFDVKSGKQVGFIPQTMNYPMALAFTPDGKALAIGHSNGAIRLVNLNNPKLSPDTTGHRAPVKALAFHPGGKWLVSASADSLRIWDMTSGEEKRVLPGSVFGYTGMALSADGAILAGAQERFIHLYDTATWLKTDTFAAEIAVEGLAFAPDGTTLLSNIGQIDLVKKKYRLGNGIYPASAFSPDGGVLARSTSKGWGPYLFRADGSKIHALQIDLLGGPFALSPLGKSIVTAKRDVREVVIYEQDTGKRRWSMWIPSPAQALALSPDARLLAVGMNTDILVWDFYVGRKLEFNGHFRPITTLAFSADGKTLASGSEDSTVLLWDLSDKVPRRVPHYKKLSAKDREKCWNDLADDWDIAEAFGTIQKLIQVPEQALPLLRKRLAPIAREYKKVKTDPPDPEYLRFLRGLEVLEFIGTAPALKLVTELSQMAAAPILRAEAQAALARMKKQQKK